MIVHMSYQIGKFIKTSIIMVNSDFGEEYIIAVNV